MAKRRTVWLVIWDVFSALMVLMFFGGLMYLGYVGTKLAAERAPTELPVGSYRVLGRFPNSSPVEGVWHDERYNVTCWYRKDGISCLPDVQLRTMQ